MNLHEHLAHLRSLDNDSLLRSLKRHVGSSNRINALVLAHLAEVDARGAYRDWACQTLAAYCVYELRLSEDEAQRRCRAARVARQFPVLLEMLADASMHLTGILLLAPYLTDENHREVLARARYRRKREIERLVAELAPAADVPALIEPIHATLQHLARAPSTWAALVAGNEGWVRHLKTGDGPTHAPSAPDAWDEALSAALDASHGAAPVREQSQENDAPARNDSKHEADAPARTHATAPEDAQARIGSLAAGKAAPSIGHDAPARTHATAPEDAQACIVAAGASACSIDDDAAPAGSQRPVAPPPLALRAAPALRYRVQFSADQAYVDLLERARDLLWHQLPSGDLAQVQRLALEALVDKLMTRKCGSQRPIAAEQRPIASDFVPARMRRKENDAPARADTSTDSPAATPARKDPRAHDATNWPAAAPARSRLHAGARSNGDEPSASAPLASRHIPASVRRHVWQRDGGAAHLSIREACAAARRAPSSFTTNILMPSVVHPARRTSPSAVARITSSRRNETSGREQWPSGNEWARTRVANVGQGASEHLASGCGHDRTLASRLAARLFIAHAVLRRTRRAVPLFAKTHGAVLRANARAPFFAAQLHSSHSAALRPDATRGAGRLGSGSNPGPRCLGCGGLDRRDRLPQQARMAVKARRSCQTGLLMQLSRANGLRARAKISRSKRAGSGATVQRRPVLVVSRVGCLPDGIRTLGYAARVSAVPIQD